MTAPAVAMPSGPQTGGVVRLATRGSALALAQTEIVSRLLVAAGAERAEAVVIRTRGDRESTTPAAAMEGMGWFTAEIEAALADGRADAAVHSAKDLPTELALGPRAMLIYVDRADARDGLVTRDGASLDALPSGARVGTSSLRREAFLGALRPDLVVVPMRGNVDTRLGKLEAGEVDALLLACAGLDRLGLGERIAERLPQDLFPPAPAQGVIAVEIQAGRGGPGARVALLDDPAVRRCVQAERGVLAELGGGCRLPLGAWAWHDGDLAMVAALAVEGAIHRVELRGDPADPAGLGRRVASRLRG